MIYKLMWPLDANSMWLCGPRYRKRRLLTTPLIAKPDNHRKLTPFQNGTVSDWVLIILIL